MVDALTDRYRNGEISETVYAISLGFYMPQDKVRDVLARNQVFFRNSIPFKQGTVK